jgi:membrane associated rhomboid family serine protease
MFRPEAPRSTPPRPGPASRAAAWLRREPVAAAILILCLAIEAALEGADAGLWGAPGWRDAAYTYGAFWGGLLNGWAPLYPLQPVAMFLSYSLLHGGFLHVALNMITLISLTPPVTARLGQGRFFVLYLLSAIGGGAGFALFSFSTMPMIGASGALFGMAGALLAWAWSDRRAMGWSRLEVARLLAKPMLYLIGFNVVFFFVMHGALAWGAHLGGFLTGWICALLLGRRYRPFAKTRS